MSRGALLAAIGLGALAGVVAVPIAMWWWPGAGGAAAAGPAPAASDPLARALAIPQNAAFNVWLHGAHGFAAPAPRWVPLPFRTWNDDERCIVRREGRTRVLRQGCEPVHHAVDAQVDAAYAEAFERHFGIPDCARQVWHVNGDGSEAAVRRARREALLEHGIDDDGAVIRPAWTWLARRSTATLRPAAEAIVREWGRPDAFTPAARTRVEAITSYVQNAIPYTPDVDGAQRARFADATSRCGLRTPLATLLEGGDCDSKALLLACLVRAVDPDIPLAVVEVTDRAGQGTGAPEPHACVAVGLPQRQGEATLDTERGRLVLIETTDDWDIGNLSPTTDVSAAKAFWVE